MNSHMQRDFSSRDVKKQFRHAYVLKANFNFSALKPFCERIIYAVEGYGDHIDNVLDQLEESLSDFDADKDVLVPVGNAYINFLAGVVLQKKLIEKRPAKDSSFSMAIWTADSGYKFWIVNVDQQMESYEIIQ